MTKTTKRVVDFTIVRTGQGFEVWSGKRYMWPAQATQEAAYATIQKMSEWDGIEIGTVAGEAGEAGEA